MNIALQIFRRQRELIAQGWTQHAAARDKRGQSVNSNDIKACCWCFIGALWRAQDEAGLSDDYHYSEGNPLEPIMTSVLRRMHNRACWVGFNDDPRTTQSMVLAYIDGCIAEAEKLS